MVQKKYVFRWAFLCTLALWCSACAAGSPQPTLAATALAAPLPTILPSASAIPVTAVPSSIPTIVTAAPSRIATLLATQPPTATATPTRPVNTANAVRENTPVPQPAAHISLDNASRISELALWGSGSASDLAYSPDGNTLAVASSLGIYLYDDNSYRVDTIETEQVITSLAFSPDGETLAAGDKDGQISLWRWRKKELIQTLDSGRSGPISFLSYSPKENVVGYIQGKCNNNCGDIYVIRITDGTKLVNGHPSGGKSFAFSKDGQGIYYTNGMFAGYFSINSNQESSFKIQFSQDEPPRPVVAVALSADGKFLAGGNVDLYLWDTQKDTPNQKTPVYSRYAVAPYLAPTCKGAGDGWDVEYATAMDISPDNQYIAVGGKNDVISIGKVDGGKMIYAASISQRSFFAGKSGISKIMFHPSKPKFVVLYNNGLIEERDTVIAKLLQKIAGHPQAYTAVAVAPKSLSGRNIIATGATSAIASLWDLASGKRVNEFDWQANVVAFSPDGGTLAVGTEDWDIQLVSLAGGKQVEPITGHQDQVKGLAFLSDGKSLLSTAYDCTLRFWDISGNSPKESDPPLKIDLSTSKVIASPDGKWVALMANEKVSLVERPDSRKYWLTPLPGFGTIMNIAFSPDSKILAGVGHGKVELYDLEKRVIIHTFNADQGQVVFSPDGKILAFGNEEGAITLMDANTGMELYRFKAHRGSVTGLAFSKDGRILISTAADGTVRLWGVME